MSRHKSGFTIIELLIVVLVIGILTAIAVPKFQQVKGRARAAALRADLRNLATAQEEYLSVFMVYANSVGAMPEYSSSEGVTVTIVEATGGGWSATTTHPLSYPLVCALFHGTAAPLAPATQEGTITCA